MSVDSKMSKDYLLFEQWKLASLLHRHEDDLSWRRIQYFLAINGTLLTVVALTINRISEIKNTGGATDGLEFLLQVISVFGFFLCLIWVFAQGRAQAYHSSWIHKAKLSERLLVPQGETEPPLTLYTDSLQDVFSKDNIEKYEIKGGLKPYAKIPIQNLVIGFAIILAAAWVVGFFAFLP